MDVVVLTAVTHGYDELSRPPAWPGVRFVAFTEDARTSAPGW